MALQTWPEKERKLMTENHTHDPVTGEVVTVPVAAEHVAEAEVIAAAEVEKTRIEGETAIQLAKIAAREVPRDMEAELAALKEAMAPAEPVVEAPAVVAPTVVVSETPEPTQDVTEPPQREAPEHREPVKRDGWFGDRS